jgi:hypothetical protein
MPNRVSTKIQNQAVTIETITEYPYGNTFTFKISNPNNVHFTIKIRKPSWATGVLTNEGYVLENGFLVFERKMGKEDTIEIEFKTEIQIKEDANNEKYFSYGALFYAKPIEAMELRGKSYFTHFDDLTYKPIDASRYAYSADHQAIFSNGQIILKAKNKTTQQLENITLIPFGKTILRQVSF